jgi:uncharacterized protein
MPFDDIYILPVSDYFIIHSPLRRISALSNRMAVQYLFDILIREEKDETKTIAIDHLLDDIVSTAPTYPEDPGENVFPYFLGLIPTRACNGACVYCDFIPAGKENENMEYLHVTTAIDWMVNRMVEANKNELDIHFFGGEPLIRPDIVSVAVHHARMLADIKGLEPHFEVSTNGLVPDRTTRFVMEHMHAVVLSLDGPEDIQDRQRPLPDGKGSFEQTVRFAEKVSFSNAALYLRTCISSENVDRMPEITEWFCRSFQPSLINFENLKNTPVSDQAGLRVPDPYHFARQFSMALDIAERYGIEIINSSLSTDIPQHSSCPVGKDTLIVSPDGVINSCYLLPSRWEERGLDLSVGRIESGKMLVDLEKIKQLRDMVKNKPRCSACFCRWTCAGGCHVDVTYPDSDDAYDDYCKQTRILGVIKLLRELNQHDLLESFLQENQPLMDFAMQESDQLIDWS